VLGGCCLAFHRATVHLQQKVHCLDCSRSNHSFRIWCSEVSICFRQKKILNLKGPYIFSYGTGDSLQRLVLPTCKLQTICGAEACVAAGGVALLPRLRRGSGPLAKVSSINIFIGAMFHLVLYIYRGWCLASKLAASK
jgi:hypothetical protein